MSDPYIGQISMTAFDYAPPNYGLCNGQAVPVAQNGALFALIGTIFGGDGSSDFKLPDLRGRIPVGKGDTDYALGSHGGVEQVTLTEAQMPAHTHRVEAFIEQGDKRLPNEQRLLAAPSSNLYRANASNLVELYSASVSSTGSGLPHDNMDLSMVISFMIAMDGIFPPRR